MLNTSLLLPWETCTSPPSNFDGRTMMREANIPCDFSVLRDSQKRMKTILVWCVLLVG